MPSRLVAFLLVASSLIAGTGRAWSQEPPPALSGHTGAVASAAYSPDGRWIVSGSFDRTLKIWNAADGKELRSLSGHSGQVLTVAVAPDGRRFASGSRDNSVRIWDLYIPTPLQHMAGHTEAVSAVLFSPVTAEPAWSATAGADKLIKLWEPEGKLLRELAGHPASVTRLATSKDATQLASGDAAGIVRLWNPADGKELAILGADTTPIVGLGFHPTTGTLLTAAENGSVKLWALPVLPSQPLAGHTAAVPAVAVSADAKQIVSGGADATVRLFNGEDGKLLRALAAQPGPVTAVDLHDATGLVASSSSEGVIKLWNAADGADRLSLHGHTGAIHDVRINAKGDTLASAGEDGSVRLWRLPAAAMPLAGHTMPVLSVAVTSDAKLIATGSADKSIKLFNGTGGAAVRTLAGASDAVRAVAFRADNAQLASADASGDIRLWNPADGTPLAALSGHVGPATSLAYLPDGKSMISTGDDGTLRWWTLPPAAPLPLAAATGEVQRVVKSTAGTELIVGSADGAIRVFTASSGALARPLAGHTGPVSALASGANVVASGDAEGNVRLWTLSTAAVLPTIAAHDGPILGLAIDPKGTQIASAGEDGSVRIWKLPVATKPLPGSALPVTVSAFSGDGALLACGGIVGGKATIVVRDASSGAVKSTVVGHEAAVTSLAFSADKTKLISGSADKTSRVWNIAAAQAAELASFTFEAAVGAVALSPDSQQAFGGAANGVLKQWKVADATEVRAFAGHTGAITCLDVRGAVLVSGSADTTVRQWNVSNGAAVRSLAHGAAVTQVTTSNDGTTIASAGAGKLVKLWNAANGAALPVLTGHPDAIRSVAFNTDGSRIVSTAGDGLRMWDNSGNLLERFPHGDKTLQSAAFAADGSVRTIDGKHVLHLVTPSLVHLLDGHQGPVHSVAFSPAGTSLASGGMDKTVRLWAMSDGKPLATFAGSTGAVADVQFSADGKLLAAAEGNTARLWPVPPQAAPQPIATQQELAHPTPVRAIAFSPDGTRLAAGLEVPANTLAAAASELATVTVWDLASGRPLQRLAGHAGAVEDVEFLADGTTVVSGSKDKTTLLRPLAASRMVVAAEGKVGNLSLCTDGTLVATASDDKKVKVWKTADAALHFEIAMGAVSPTSVALRGDKLQLAAAGSDNKLYLWPVSGQTAGTVVNAALPSPVAELQYSRDGMRLTTASADKQLRVYDATDASLLETIATADAPVCSTFSPDATSLIAAGGNAATIQPLSLLQRLVGHEGAVTTVAFLPDGTGIVSGGADKTLRLWTLADGKQVRTFSGPAAAITRVAIDGKGTLLVAGSADKFARTWNLATNTPTVAPTLTLEHPGVVHSASISDDGSRIVTAAEDAIRAWDSTSGRELQRFTDHQGAALSVAMAADGKRFVSGGADKLARLTPIAVVQLIVAAETKLGEAAFLNDGATIATTGSDKQVKIWDLEGKPVRGLAGAKVELTRLAIRGDGMQIAAADAEGRLMLWNAADGALQQTLETGAVVHDLSYSLDHKRLAAAGADNHLRVFQAEVAAEENPLLQDQIAPAPLLAVRFAPSGSELLTGSADHSASLWAYASPTPVAELAGHTGPVLSLAYANDGKLLASTSSDGTIRTWNLETHAAVRAIAGHTGPVYSARFSADSQQLVSCGADGSVRLWTVASGAAVRQMSPMMAEGESPPALYDVAISPNGQQAAASGQDGAIRLWNLANGQPGTSIEAGPAPAYRLEFLPTNQLLAAGHAGNLTLWNPANATKVLDAKVPGVAYSAALSPIAKHAAVPCADGKTYFLKLP